MVSFFLPLTQILPAEMYTVYILYSQRVDRYYVGYTNDLERRLSEHNRPKGKFTDRGIPWELCYSEVFLEKSAAYSREQFIKAQKSRTYIQALISSGC